MGSKLHSSWSLTSYWHRFGNRELDSILHGTVRLFGVLLVYVLLRFVLLRLLENVLGKVATRSMRFQTLRGLLGSILSYILFFVFAIQALAAVGLQIMPFVEAAGIAGLAIGFGAQKLVKDVISGFFLIIDSVLEVGDVVTIGAVTGVVSEMGMRITQVKDLSGRLYLIPNGDIGTVANLSRQAIVDSVDISIAPVDKLENAVEVVNRVGQQLYESEPGKFSQPPAFIGVTAVSAASATLRVSLSAHPNDLPLRTMQLRGALLNGLKQASIDLA